MALYNLDRAHKAMAALSDKATWEPQDTSSFDCMHYFGNAALDHAANKIGLKPGDRVLDIGSGFGGTGRYLHQNYGADVTGIELQAGIHEMAKTINQRNGMESCVRSLNADFTQLVLAEPVDHIVSFLCINHIPDRGRVFGKVAELLKPGGILHIEDLYLRSPLDEQSETQLRNVMSCPYLPSLERYKEDLEGPGFRDIEIEDMSEAWSAFVHERAVTYGATPSPEPSLLGFYDTVDSLFSRGILGGARFTCVNGRQ